MANVVFKIIVLITIIALGWLLYPLTVNLLLKANIMNIDFATENLKDMTDKAVLVWIGASILGMISVFIKQKWRYILLLCPLIGPSLFVLIFTLGA